MKHEHLRVDISPAALEAIAALIETGGSEDGHYWDRIPREVQVEIENFINECRARVQHAAAGEPDTSEDPLPIRRGSARIPNHDIDDLL